MLSSSSSSWTSRPVIMCPPDRRHTSRSSSSRRASTPSGKSGLNSQNDDIVPEWKPLHCTFSIILMFWFQDSVPSIYTLRHPLSRDILQIIFDMFHQPSGNYCILCSPIGKGKFQKKRQEKKRKHSDCVDAPQCRIICNDPQKTRNLRTKKPISQIGSKK